MKQQAVSIDEVKRILNMEPNPDYHMLIETLWITGGRVTEALELKPENIGEDYLVMHNLKQRDPKNDYKTVVVPQQFIDTIRQYIEENSITNGQFIFISKKSRKNRKDHMSRQQANLVVKEAARRAGVMKVSSHLKGTIVPAWPHCFRHGNASRLYETTQDIMFVKEQLGHASLANTQIYIETSEASKRKYVEKAF